MGWRPRRNFWVRFTEEPRRVLLHGHCHQKALVGTGPARRILALPPGYTVDEVDSGCCGMAGSFGYEAEHYAISMRWRSGGYCRRRGRPRRRRSLPPRGSAAASRSPTAAAGWRCIRRRCCGMR